MTKPKPEKDAKKPADKDAPHDGGWRETIESIAMAVILALLFRGFVAEAFVIPTGSMAPTLDGRHKDVECPKCHQWYQVSGSQEQRDDVPTGMHVISTTCPICRYTKVLDPVNRPNEGSFSGDRIIVGKFCYDFAEPKRWDVIVFKYPGNAVQNYIKRLIGLPGERVRVVGGNIHTCGASEPDEKLQIARKPPGKLNTLLQLVDDTDHIPQDLIDLGWPSRWQPYPQAAGWKALDGGRGFSIAADQPQEAWLRYRHLVPSPADWTAIESTKQLPPGVAERPGQLITDYYAYNTNRELGSDTVPFWECFLFQSYRPPAQIPQTIGPEHIPNEAAFGQHWVDDLAVECLAEITSQKGEISLLLVRGGVKHVCRIDLASGVARLSMTDATGAELEFSGADGKPTPKPVATTRVKGPGSYRLRLSNCDHDMLLWVNGSVVQFAAPTTYDGGELIDPYYSAADPGDLAPAGIGAAKGAAVKVSSLRIYRDKYYIATRADYPFSPADGDDYDLPVQILQDRSGSTESEAIARIMADPKLWDKSQSNLFAENNRRFVEFTLKENQFLPMGDNSPQSYDGRYWWDRDENGNNVKHHYVERDLLIGKALLIYWPHTWNRPVPFTPNFSRMGPIR